jgi:hypothetical protein
MTPAKTDKIPGRKAETPTVFLFLTKRMIAIVPKVCWKHKNGLFCSSFAETCQLTVLDTLVRTTIAHNVTKIAF